VEQPQSVRSAVHRLALARGVSITGGAAALTALMFAVYERTGHNTIWLSAALILTFGMNGVLGWFAGGLGDRFDRRRVMVASELCGAAVFAVAAFVHSPVLLIVCGFVAAIAESPFWSASGAAIPALVDEPEQIEHANSLVAVGANLGVFLGPAIGGFLVGQIGPNWIFAANAATFLASAAMIWSIRRSFHEDVTEDEHAAHEGLWAGMRFIRNDEVLRRLLVAFTIMVAFIGFVMVSDLPLVGVFFQGPVAIGRAYGLIVAVWGIGSVAGSLSGRRLTPDVETRWLVIMTGAYALTMGLVGVAPAFSLVLVLSLFNGAFDAVSMVALRSIQVRRAPDAVRSRVVAAMEGAQNVSLALGYAIAGLLVKALGPRPVYVIAGVGGLVCTAVLWPLRHRVIEPTDIEDEGPTRAR
jgi:predicted MFS family arabinose efflux permease